MGSRKRTLDRDRRRECCLLELGRATRIRSSSVEVIALFALDHSLGGLSCFLHSGLCCLAAGTVRLVSAFTARLRRSEETRRRRRR